MLPYNARKTCESIVRQPFSKIMAKKAIITDIQRFSVHDGPGIRTVVFVKGCPLRCEWCQNPETQRKQPELMINPQVCIGCGACAAVCKEDAVTGDRKHCIQCGSCAESCYTGSRRLVGKAYTSEEIFQKVIRDEVFFKTSGGGLTISGGEAALYWEFCCELLGQAKAHGLTTAIETTGYCEFDILEKLNSFCDYFLYDIKTMDPAVHKRYTGVSNERILDNLKKLKRIGADVTIRYPFIPEINDTEQNIREVGALARAADIRQIHLLPFHQLGASKWKELDKGYKFLNHGTPSEESLMRARRILRSYVPYVNIGGNGESEVSVNGTYRPDQGPAV